MKKFRVLYLISRENILEPGVLKSQVLGLAGQIVKGNNVEITVLDLPSINRFFKYLKNYSSVKKYAQKLGIKLVVIPILPIGRSIMPLWAMPFFLIQTVPAILFFVIWHRINVINARSHLSAFAGFFVKKLIPGIKLVFENHGSYLFEGVTHGHWGKTDFDYKIWEPLEKFLFLSSDHIVARSQGLQDYIEGVSPRTPSSVVPCSVDETAFFMATRDRERGRKKLGVKDRFVVVYAGSLGSFHRPDFLAEAYFELRNHLPNPYFLIVTHSDPKNLIANLKIRGITQDEFMVIRNPHNLGRVLPLGDVALHVYSNLSIAPYVLAVKFAEYTASGLPVIVSQNLASIIGLVEGKCGVAVDFASKKDIVAKMRELVGNYGKYKKGALKLAKDYFSVRVCARKYLAIYEKIIG